MGYRSDVIFWIHKPQVGKLLTMTSKVPEAFEVLFNWSEVENNDDGSMKFIINHIKWYDAYAGIGAIEAFMRDLEGEGLDEEFGFVRLGEEFGDLERRGESELYEVYPTQHLECDRVC